MPMLRRVDADEQRHPHGLETAGTIGAEPIVSAVAQPEMETTLPRDHPKWVKDALSVSQRAKDLVTRLKPVVVRILTFWDHRVRSACIGGARVSIDPSGSYRVE
jgi:hypothetical protein